MSFGTFRKFSVSKLELDFSSASIGQNEALRAIHTPKTRTVSINSFNYEGTKDPVKLEAIIKARLEADYLYHLTSKGVKVVSFKWKEKN